MWVDKQVTLSSKRNLKVCLCMCLCFRHIICNILFLCTYVQYMQVYTLLIFIIPNIPTKVIQIFKKAFKVN